MFLVSPLRALCSRSLQVVPMTAKRTQLLFKISGLRSTGGSKLPFSQAIGHVAQAKRYEARMQEFAMNTAWQAD
jgi:hypothetical protein